ncbi:FmdB family zinc ribbon protein [Rhodomicrobium lacus]|uniref:FmdB family zinc ribbon protein n=1 Tax=Rhodomicrobium TaxID=1068 RepID=UPI000F8DD054|nr:zinc ribbon domain-containing protein [Rhodomicrobium lacus]WKW52370.1 zinc ribbon domain-containing protein [Rhodomicrobium lacus]
MPLYGFHCDKCDNDVELLVSASAKPACPICGNEAMTRLMSRIVIHGKTKAKLKAARAAAERAGHLSNFSPSERR